MLLLPTAILAYLYAGYLVILAPGRVYAALMGPDWPRFRSEMRSFGFILVLTTFLRVLRGVLRDAFANLLRARLGRRVHATYLADSVRPLRAARSPDIDNPDQRAASDTSGFADELLATFVGDASASGGLVEGCLSVGWYSAQTSMRAGMRALAAAYGWSALAGTVAALALRRAAAARSRAEGADAGLRFAHAHVRASSEEIAFSRAHEPERATLDGFLAGAVSARWGVVSADAGLASVDHLFQYAVSLVMYTAIAFAIAAGAPLTPAGDSFDRLDAAARAQWIAQTGGVFIQLLFSLSMLVAAAAPMSRLAAHAVRLRGLVDVVGGRAEGEKRACDDVGKIELRSLTVGLPCGERAGPVTLSVPAGSAVALVGPSGCGKTSLLRALRGLNRPSGGGFTLPPGTEFVPQRPRTPHGVRSLRSAVLYPDADDASLTSSVSSALSSVGWARSGSVDKTADWSAILSPGELQRLAIAGILVRRPKFAVLDEPTSNLDEEAERRCFEALRERGVGLLSVVHSGVGIAAHQRVVRLRGTEWVEEDAKILV